MRYLTHRLLELFTINPTLCAQRPEYENKQKVASA